jgi:hypothetical protein
MAQTRPRTVRLRVPGRYLSSQYRRYSGQRAFGLPLVLERQREVRREGELPTGCDLAAQVPHRTRCRRKSRASRSRPCSACLTGPLLRRSRRTSRQPPSCWPRSEARRLPTLSHGSYSMGASLHLGVCYSGANGPCRHYDVISAPREGWASDPFTLAGRDGYLYGRGATDNKGPVLAVACAAAALLDRPWWLWY